MFQSELYPNEPEPQIMEYKTQQNKLFPSLARIFAFHFTAKSLREAYHFTQESIEEMGKNEESSDEGEEKKCEKVNEALEKADFALAELHMLSCGLKALFTQEVADSIDTLRRACGGHGFMSCSNLPRLFGLATAACTYEGENTVMQLQVGYKNSNKCHLKLN